MAYSYCGVTIPDLRVDTISACLQTHYPAVWKRHYTKHIDVPGNYHGFKTIACLLAGGELTTKIEWQTRRNIACNQLPVSRELEKHDWPTYFLHANLFEALRRTHPPKEMTWRDVAFPFDALMFMLPKGSLQDPTGANIYMLGIAKISGPVILPTGEIAYTTVNGNTRIIVFWAYEPAGIAWHDCAFPIGESLEPDPAWIDKATAEMLVSGKTLDCGPVSGEFSSVVAGICANLLLVMEARPEVLEPGTRTMKRLGNGTPVHAPTFLGRRYTIQRQYPKGEAKGHFTELGWRAGHYKQQAHGTGRKERKRIWIDPYIAYASGLRENGTGGSSDDK